MQYTLVDLLKPEHIATGLDASDSGQAIHALTDLLVQSGSADPGFAADVLAREQTFPTGLPTQPVPVAIPHADPVHLIRSSVAIGILKAPVQFGQMGTDGSTILDAKIIFLLAIVEREKQVEMIQQLIALIQSPDLLLSLTQAGDAGEALRLIRQTLDK
jgi:PTS system galactitol-specific IIA component